MSSTACPRSASSTAVARSGTEPMWVSPTRTSSIEPSPAFLTSARHGHHRPVLLAAVELLVAVAVARELREADRGEDLALADRGRQVVLEEVGGRDLALAAGCRGSSPSPPRRAGSRAGRRPGRRARASRRSCPCCGPAGRRSSPPRRPRARSCRSRPRGGGSSRRSGSRRRRRTRRVSSSTRRRSTSSEGAASRSFISGISECPPASTFASSPPSASACSASSSEPGAT